MGEGPDHGQYDVYIGGSLWQSFSGYAATPGERVIPIPLSNDGPFTLQVNNRADKGSASSGHVMSFKQLSVDAEYTLQTIKYIYDAASRVLGVDYYLGENTASTTVQMFAYEDSVAGNLTGNNGMARPFNKLNRTGQYSERHIVRLVVESRFDNLFRVPIVPMPTLLQRLLSKGLFDRSE